MVVSWQKSFLPSTSGACVMGEKFRMTYRSPDGGLMPIASTESESG